MSCYDLLIWTDNSAFLLCYVTEKIVTQAGRPMYSHLWMGFLFSTLFQALT